MPRHYLLLALVGLPLIGRAQLLTTPVPADSIRRVLVGPEAWARPVPPSQGVRLARQRGVTVVDVRPAAAYGAGHLRGALSLPFESDQQFLPAVKSFRKNRVYLIYGATEQQSFEVASVLAKLGRYNGLIGGSYATLRAAGAAAE